MKEGNCPAVIRENKGQRTCDGAEVATMVYAKGLHLEFGHVCRERGLSIADSCLPPRGAISTSISFKGKQGSRTYGSQQLLSLSWMTFKDNQDHLQDETLFHERGNLNQASWSL